MIGSCLWDLQVFLKGQIKIQSRLQALGFCLTVTFLLGIQMSINMKVDFLFLFQLSAPFLLVYILLKKAYGFLLKLIHCPDFQLLSLLEPQHPIDCFFPLYMLKSFQTYSFFITEHFVYQNFYAKLYSLLFKACGQF